MVGFFPGMDPYLEHPALWPDVHHRLITYAGDALQERLGERYYAAIERRVYRESADRLLIPDSLLLEAPRSGGASLPGERAPEERPSGERVADPPRVAVLEGEDVEVREACLEIRDALAGDRVVTVIELLSPANKRPGAGRESYLRKQRELLGARVNLVEVDLLRAGEHTVAIPEPYVQGSDYRAVIVRATDRTRREYYTFGVRDPLPRIVVPLEPSDEDAVLDLPALVAEAYRRGAYARQIAYEKEPVPPLSAEDATWARERVDATGGG